MFQKPTLGTLYNSWILVCAIIFKYHFRWEDFWDLMSEDCRDECCVVESEHLMEMLENYLQKHKYNNI